ncbi:hypothetical protein [Planomonospora sphaerica]
MSAAPLSETELRPEPSVWDPLPDWVLPPRGGFTADDLDRLPGIPRTPSSSTALSSSTST